MWFSKQGDALKIHDAHRPYRNCKRYKSVWAQKVWRIPKVAR